MQMKKTVTLGEALSMLLGIITLVSIWAINLNEKVSRNDLRIDNIEKENYEMKRDVKEIKNTTTQILITLENKVSRDEIN